MGNQTPASGGGKTDRNDELVLRYVGAGAALPNVPALGLTSDMLIQAWARARNEDAAPDIAAFQQALIDTGLYVAAEQQDGEV